MGVLHFLNVMEGDCTIIEHSSGRVTVLDVNNASIPEKLSEAQLLANKIMELSAGLKGNFGQAGHPVNPVQYMRDRGIKNVFRFILSHPDMDHMGGIKDFFEEFGPPNFWDTDNTEEKDFAKPCKYNEDDWRFYKSLRDGAHADIKRLVKYSGDVGSYWNQDPDGAHDGLHILAPTRKIVHDANDCGDNNDCSYVLLYRNSHFKIVLAGDSHDESWAHILQNHKADVTNVDLLIAPHHGRDSDRTYDFLDVLRPKMTFFGCAPSEHVAYDAWSRRELEYITNNQANCMIVTPAGCDLDLYVTNESFAQSRAPYTFYSNKYEGWFLRTISKKAAVPV